MFSPTSFEHATDPVLKCKREGVSKSERPDRPVLSSRLVVKRIVDRDITVGINAENLSEQIRERLRVSAIRILAYRDVQLSIRTKVNRSTIMVRRTTEVVQIEENRLAAVNNDVAIRSEPGDTSVNTRCRSGIVDIHKMISRKVRVERDSQQTALANRAHSKRQERLREQCAVLDHSKCATLLADEDAPIRCKRHRRSRRKRIGKRDFRKAGG